MRRDILKAILVVSMTALPLGGAYAGGPSVILDCSYQESNHQQRSPSGGGNVDWFPAREVIYRICDGCTLDAAGLRDAGYITADRAPVWRVSKDEYSYEYRDNVRYGVVRINRYSGAATSELHAFGDGDLYIAGSGVFFISHGTCKKRGKPAL